MSRVLDRLLDGLAWVMIAVGSAILLGEITTIWDPFREHNFLTIILGVGLIVQGSSRRRKPVLTEEEERTLRREEWERFMEGGRDREGDDGGR